MFSKSSIHLIFLSFQKYQKKDEKEKLKHKKEKRIFSSNLTLCYQKKDKQKENTVSKEIKT